MLPQDDSYNTHNIFHDTQKNTILKIWPIEVSTFFPIYIFSNKVGHLLSDSNSKLAIEFGDRILLSNISSEVSEIFGRIEIESEFRQ